MTYRSAVNRILCSGCVWFGLSRDDVTQFVDLRARSLVQMQLKHCFAQKLVSVYASSSGRLLPFERLLAQLSYPPADRWFAFCCG